MSGLHDSIHFREDSRTIGEYYVMLPDGRVQRVRYTVEGPYGGFKAEVSYEGKTKIPKSGRPHPHRPVRLKQPSYERGALRTVDSVPTYAGSTPRPSLVSTLNPQFLHPKLIVLKFQQKNEPKLRKYSYKTLSGKYPSPAPAVLGPSSGLSPTVKGRPETSEEGTANTPGSRTAMATPQPTPYTLTYFPPPNNFQDPLPPRASSNYYQNPSPDVVRRFTYRPLEAEEEKEEGNNDDGNERTNNIHGDHLEVVQPSVVGAPPTSPPRLHPPPKKSFRNSEIKTLSPLHYSLSSPYPPLHHPYALQDHLYPLPSVKRYTFKEVPDDEDEEEEADVDIEDDGTELPEESFEGNNETELEDKVNRIGAATKTADEPDPDETQVSREEKSEEKLNDDVQMTNFEDLELPESEVWGYRYLP